MILSDQAMNQEDIMRFFIILLMVLLLNQCTSSDISIDKNIINTYWSLRRYCNWDIYAKPVVRCDLATYVEENDPEFYESAISNPDGGVLDEHAFFSSYVEHYDINSRDFRNAYREILQEEIENGDGNLDDCGLMPWFFGNLAGEIGDDILNALLYDWFHNELDEVEYMVYLWTIEVALKYDQINGLYSLANYLAEPDFLYRSSEKLGPILMWSPYGGLRGTGEEAETCLNYFSQTLIDIYNETDIYRTGLRFLCVGYLGKIGTKENIDYLFLKASDIDNSQIERIYGLVGLLRYIERYNNLFDVIGPFIFGINKETFLIENLNMPILMGDRYELEYLKSLIKNLDEPANITATLEYTANSINHIPTNPQPLFEFIMGNIDIIREYDYVVRFRNEINLTKDNWLDTRWLEEVMNLIGED